MTATLDVIDSYLALDSTQYAQVPIGATRVATKGNATLQGNIPAWSPAADFRIKCKFITTGTPSGTVYTILAGTGANTTKFFLYQGNGVLDRLTLRIEQSAVQYFVQSATTLLLDVVNEITIERISGATTMTLNGSPVNVQYTLDTFDVARIYYRDGYGPLIGGCVWDLELTDLTTPANSRFYPLDSAYPSYTTTRQIIASDSMSAPITPSAITLEGSWIDEGGGVYSRPWGTDGSALRFNLPASIGKTYLFTFDLERVQGGSVKLMNDSSVYVNGATGSYSVLITPSEHTSSQEIRFARYSGVDGWGGKVKNLVIREVYNAGLWYNRTSGDVVTVYPDAIKPGEEFYFAIKYKVTDVSKNSGFNNPFSIGRRASGAYSCISLYLPESNGKFYVDPYNGLSRTTGSGIPGRTMGVTHLDGLTHVAVVRLKADGSYECWVDATTPKYTGVPNSQLAYAMDVINLNGYANATTGAVARMGINFHYVYLYSALSAGDITALMQGANPETVGTIRQGYNLNGNGNEVNGGNALTLYNAPSFVRRISIPTLVDSLTSRKLITSLIGSVVS